MIEQIETMDEADLDARIFAAQRKLDTAQNALEWARLNYGELRSPANKKRVLDAMATVDAAAEVLQDLHDEESNANLWGKYTL